MQLIRTFRLAACAALLSLVSLPAAAQAPVKLTFATNWYAEAEHGGFYQAIAEGIYKKHGLDVTVKMGGPQVNGLQLLVANQIDLFSFQSPLERLHHTIDVIDLTLWNVEGTKASIF